jgi:hypothetical protein
MIAGIFHEGSGLGNQLHRYVATRVLALDKGYEWGMMNCEAFKGSNFLSIPLQEAPDNPVNPKYFEEQKVQDNNGTDIRSYDPEINFVQDNTVIDGEFQDERYFAHRMDDVNRWLKVEPLAVLDDVCIIGFRGGEYKLFPNLFLPQSYWDNAIAFMRAKGITKFEVHTDDPDTARTFFPDLPIVDTQAESHSKHSNMGLNWRAVRDAKHAIIANSSFYILPRLLQHHGNKDAVTIAPRYWARHNQKTWALPQNYYKAFTYLHAEDPHTNKSNMEA